MENKIRPSETRVRVYRDATDDEALRRIERKLDRLLALHQQALVTQALKSLTPPVNLTRAGVTSLQTRLRGKPMIEHDDDQLRAFVLQNVARLTGRCMMNESRLQVNEFRIEFMMWAIGAMLYHLSQSTANDQHVPERTRRIGFLELNGTAR